MSTREDYKQEVIRLAARAAELEEALRHVFYRNHKHSDSCDACIAAEILAKGGKS